MPGSQRARPERLRCRPRPRTLSSVESLFNEPSDNGLAEQLNTFWKSWAAVANNPGEPGGPQRGAAERRAHWPATLNAEQRCAGPAHPVASASRSPTSPTRSTPPPASSPSSTARSRSPAPPGRTPTPCSTSATRLLMNLSDLTGAQATIQADGTATVTLGGQSAGLGHHRQHGQHRRRQRDPGRRQPGGTAGGKPAVAGGQPEHHAAQLLRPAGRGRRGAGQHHQHRAGRRLRPGRQPRWRRCSPAPPRPPSRSRSPTRPRWPPPARRVATSDGSVALAMSGYGQRWPAGRTSRYQHHDRPAGHRRAAGHPAGHRPAVGHHQRGQPGAVLLRRQHRRGDHQPADLPARLPGILPGAHHGGRDAGHLDQPHRKGRL